MRGTTEAGTDHSPEQRGEPQQPHAWLSWVQLAALAWVCWLPVSLGVILYPALLLIFLTSAAMVLLRRYRPSRAAQIAWGVYYLWAVAWTIVSYSWRNPGVWHQAALWLGLPVLWGTWALSMNVRQAKRTINVLLAVGALGSALTLWLVASGIWDLPGLPSWLIVLQDTRVNVSPVTGETEFNYLGLSSMVGIGALAIAAACLPETESWLPSRATLLTVGGLVFVSAAASGRTGLLLALVAVTVAVPAIGVVILIWTRAGPRCLLRYLGGLFAGVVALTGLTLTPLGVNITTLASDVGAVVGLSIDRGSDAPDAPDPDGPGPSAPDDPINDLQAQSDQARGTTIRELMDAGRQAPFWGHGFGATLDSGFERSEERPWMFEAEPLQVFMNVGLLGVGVLALLVLVLLRAAFGAVTARRHRRAVLAGLAVFAAVTLASATNPYLQAPGHGWMLFLAGGVVLAASRVPASTADEADGNVSVRPEG